MTNEIHMEKFLRLDHVLKRTGLSRSYIYKSVNDGTFPAPRKVGDRTSVWLKSELEDWMQSIAGIEDAGE